MIFGLTGKYASGKGEVAHYLQKKGYRLHSLADVLREEVQTRGLSMDRPTLIRIGQALRREQGPGVLAKRLLPQLKPQDVVDSIRHPEEIRVLKTLDDLVVIGVEAPPALRFERLRGRARPGDAETFEEFVRQEALEDTRDPLSQQLSECLLMADYLVSNTGTREALFEQVDRILEKILTQTTN